MMFKTNEKWSCHLLSTASVPLQSSPFGSLTTEVWIGLSPAFPHVHWMSLMPYYTMRPFTVYSIPLSICWAFCSNHSFLARLTICATNLLHATYLLLLMSLLELNQMAWSSLCSLIGPSNTSLFSANQSTCLFFLHFLFFLCLVY